MKKKDYLFILSNGRVAAINKKDGAIVWEVKLKEYLSSKMTLTYGQIAVEDDKLFIGSTGMLLCLSTKDGSLIWKNELKGWGYSFVSMSNAGADAASAAAMQAAAAANAAVIAATV
jgi:outer membrane protein assembly factor BamB